ncbi:MAG: hypothetical protein AAF741_10775 [Bacteroidota bacterium]
MSYNKFIILVLVLSLPFVFFTCKESHPITSPVEEEEMTQGQIDSLLDKFKFFYEQPIVIDSSSHIIIPISTRLIERKSIYSKDGYASDSYPRYWNALFYNRETSASRLLSKRKIRISRIHAKGNNGFREENKTFGEMVLYEMGDIDYNKDGKLDNKDPEFLFSSKQDGMGLKRITPKDESLKYFQIIKNTNQILIKTLRDINSDLIFDQADEPIWYKAELRGETWDLHEVIDSTRRNEIKNLYFEQWLKGS